MNENEMAVSSVTEISAADTLESENVTAVTEESEIEIAEAETEAQGEAVTFLEAEETEEAVTTEAEISETAISEQTSIETIITLEEETLERQTEAITEAVVTAEEKSPSAAELFNTYKKPITYMGAVVLLAALGAYYFSLKKKSSSGRKSAKQRESERINSIKKAENEKKQKDKKGNTKKKTGAAKTVGDTIPYRKCLPNDIWQLDDKRYSKVYEISDINYNLGDENQQDEILYNYRTFLNSLENTEECQICVQNSPIDVEEYEKNILLKMRGDGFDDLRDEYNNRVLIPALSKGNNAIRKNIYITMTVMATDEAVANRRFNAIDLKVKNAFDKIGNTQLRALTNQERLEVLKTFYINKEYKLPEFTAEDLKKGIEKTYIAPDYFDFTKPDYFMFGDYYCKAVFIKEYPHEAGDTIIKDLVDTNLELTVTTTLFAYDTPTARKVVQRKIGDVTADMGAREQKAVKAGYFNTTMPQRIKNMLDDFRMLFDMISVEDQKLFLANTIIMVKAKTYDELKTSMELVESSLKSNGCSYSEMKYQQEDGMCDCLPIGTQRKFQWNRSLPSESIEILTPFNVKEIQQENAIYYGRNKLSNNMVTFGRITGGLVNPAGFILGISGSGKSFYVKREMLDGFLRYPDAEYIVIDPEREYPSMAEMFNGQSIKVSASSKNYINPFDFDLALLDDEDYDVIKEKSQLITSFIACMYTDRSLTPQETSFIDRCVRLTYVQSGFLNTLDPKDMPILQDFYDIMAVQTENVDPKMKGDMLATLEMYVGEGSANYFNHQTSVDIYNRFVSFDIKELSGVLKTQAMLLVLDNIWNRLSANREKKIPTWIYVDEIHVLFANPYCLNFIQQLYKRARKYGGVITGITQNIIDILRDDSCVTMLSNCEFITLLKQSPSDILKLKDVLHYSDSELDFVGNISAGEGLLVLGKDKIPFTDSYPKDTVTYSKMSTSFSETRQAKEEANKRNQRPKASD